MITNTANMEGRDAATLMLLCGIGNDAIPAMERRGQEELVNSDVLPAEINGQTREQFEQLGVVFGAPVEGDDLFQHVTLPAGWKRAGTDHDMWSNVVDDQGRVRINVFYKAAFYDRRADMHLSRRYAISTYADDCKRENEGKTEIRAKVTDAGKEIWSGEWTAAPEDRNKMYQLKDRQEREAREWLDANRPKWLSQNFVEAWED